MSEGLVEVLRPPPWFGVDDVIVVIAVIALKSTGRMGGGCACDRFLMAPAGAGR